MQQLRNYLLDLIESLFQIRLEKLGKTKNQN